MVERLRTAGGILPMFEEDGFGVRMRGQEPDEFDSAIAGEAGHAYLIFIHRTE
jgi:hypothetical protein